MKAIFISFNQAYFESIMSILSQNNIKGFTHWDNVAGRGSNTGEPHYGDHAWPTLNGVIWTIIEHEKVNSVLIALNKLDMQSEQQGLRAFVLNVEQMI